VAIQKANHEVPEKEQASDFLISEIIRSLETNKKGIVPIEEIQDYIEKQLIEMHKSELAKKYIIYRYQRALVRKANTTDDSILTLIRNDNKEVGQENSNKDSAIASTQRDLIAGEVSKDITRRMILPEDVRVAHDE
jgi:ribonucleoside-triphosphate reductase